MANTVRDTKTAGTVGKYVGSAQKFAFKWLRTQLLDNKKYLWSDWGDAFGQYHDSK